MTCKNRGFTLAELLVVVAIIGVLVAIAIPVFGGSLEKARAATCSANRRSLLGEITTAVMLDDNVSGVIGTSEVAWEDVKSQFADAGYNFQDVICPDGGNITVRRVSTDGGFVVICDKHQGSAGDSDGADDTEQYSDTAFLKKFSAAVQSYATEHTTWSNDNYREAFFEDHGSKWPTMQIDGVTYQIEPYYCKATAETWLFAREGNGESFINSWNVPLVYNPKNNKWYQYYYWDMKKSASISFNSMDALNTAVTAVATNPKDAQWREVAVQ